MTATLGSIHRLRLPAHAERVRPWIDSEVEPLRRVLLHRPGRELARLTPSNKEELLFDELPWMERAQEEHDAFAAVLRGRDVEVLYVADLLADVLDDPEAREDVLVRTFETAQLAPALVQEVKEWLASLGSRALADWLIAGVAFAELPVGTDTLSARMAGPHEFVLPPLTNQLFTRDSSVWIHHSVHVNSMATPARRREALHLEAIYRRHPLFADVSESDASLCETGTIEGGDVLVIGNGCVLVGVGDRTRAAAVEELAADLFASGAATQVVAVQLPHTRAVMHLDTILTMVDRDAFTCFPAVAHAAKSFRLRPGRFGRLRVDEVADLFAGIADALGTGALRVIATGGGPRAAEREQWDDANNVLAIAPGVVVGYDRNVQTNARLSDAGIEVLTIPSGELGRGRGGARCMSCPIERARSQT